MTEAVGEPTDPALEPSWPYRAGMADDERQETTRKSVPTWGQMISRVTPANFASIVPAWLLFALGGTLAAFGDTRGILALVVIGFCIALPAFAWFASLVWRILFTENKEP